MDSYLVIANSTNAGSLEIFTEGINSAVGHVQDLMLEDNFYAVKITKTTVEEFEKRKNLLKKS